MTLAWLEDLAGRAPDHRYAGANTKDAHAHTRTTFFVALDDGQVLAFVPQGVVKRVGADGHYGTDWEIVRLSPEAEVLGRVELDHPHPVRAVVAHRVGETVWVFFESAADGIQPMHCRRFTVAGGGLEEIDRRVLDVPIASLRTDFEGTRALLLTLSDAFVFELTADGPVQTAKVRYSYPDNDKGLYFSMRAAALCGEKMVLMGTAEDDRDRSYAHLKFYGLDGAEPAVIAEKQIYNRSGFEMAWWPDDVLAFWSKAFIAFDVRTPAKPKAIGTPKLWSRIVIASVQRVGEAFVGFGTGNQLKIVERVEGKVKKVGDVRLTTRVDGALIVGRTLWTYDARKGVAVFHGR